MQTRKPGANPFKFKFNSPLKPEIHKTASEKVWTAITSRLRSLRGPTGSASPPPVRVPPTQALARPTLRVTASALPAKPKLDSGNRASPQNGELRRREQLKAKLAALPLPAHQRGFASDLRKQAGQLLAQAQGASGQSIARRDNQINMADLMIRAIDASLPVDRLLAHLDRAALARRGKEESVRPTVHQMKLANRIDDVMTHRDQFMQAAALQDTDPLEIQDAMRQALKGLALANRAFLDAMEPEASWTVERQEAPTTLRALAQETSGEDVPAEQRELGETWIVEHISLDPAKNSASRMGDNVTRAALP